MAEKIIPYIPALFPNKNDFKNAIKILEENNTKYMEIGILSENPYLDGNAISNAMKNILSSGISVEKSIEETSDIIRNINIHFIAMMYYETYLSFKESIIPLIKTSGHKSILIPNIKDYEEEKILRNECDKHSLGYASFLPYGSSLQMLNDKISITSSFIYIQSYSGQTGSKLSITDEWKKHISHIVENAHRSKIKTGVGFGIKSKEDVEKVLNTKSDFAIIGSETVKRLQNGICSFTKYIKSF